MVTQKRNSMYLTKQFLISGLAVCTLLNAANMSKINNFDNESRSSTTYIFLQNIPI